MPKIRSAEKQGEPLVRPTDNNRRWTEYFKKLLNMNDQGEEDTAYAGEITMEVVIRVMKICKALGEDGIPIELMKDNSENDE